MPKSKTLQRKLNKSIKNIKEQGNTCRLKYHKILFQLTAWSKNYYIVKNECGEISFIKNDKCNFDILVYMCLWRSLFSSRRSCVDNTEKRTLKAMYRSI